MRTAGGRGQGGATRLELAIAAIVTALLAGVLLDRLIAYQAEAERVAVKQLVSSLRTALSVRSAAAIAGGGEAELAALARQNPIRWLQKAPENYLGEFYAVREDALPAGNWYFDRSVHALVYLPSGHKSFSSGIQKILLFKVKLLGVTDPVMTSGRREVTTGLLLDQLDDQSLALNNIAVMVPRRHYSEKTQ
ncbi:hypothetical protein [Massilia sp. GCM10023247]|uniref:hypothetical protein n=1 Tax=Massilia sp. GCM10023247 TaxID=3252643 RepID=UPI003605C991